MFTLSTSVFVSVLLASFVPAASAAQLSDIERHKNQEAIEYLYSHGSITGYADGTFKPDATINRAELLKLLVGDKVASLDVLDELGRPRPEYQGCFPDVADEWFAVFVCFAKKNGWIEGYPDGTFRPAQAVNRVEAIKMLVSIEGYALPDATKQSKYSDVVSTEWYAPYVLAAEERNVLDEPRAQFDGSISFEGGSAMQRGSMAESMYRVAMLKAHKLHAYVPTDEIPTRLQVTTGNLFPLNLLNNQKWKMEIWRKDSEYFVVERDEDSFAIRGYEINASTGKAEMKYKGNEYRGEFEQFSQFDDMAFMIYECDYKYKYIREGIRCDEILLPVQISEKTVHGYSAQFSDKEGQDYIIKILSKAQEDIECTVKAQENSGELIYYMPDSAAMRKDDWRGIFKCFATEEDAIEAGYKKSFQ